MNVQEAAVAIALIGPFVWVFCYFVYDTIRRG